MNRLPNDLYYKIQQLDKSIKKKLWSQGLVVPVKENDGAVRVGRFYIKKLNSGFYSIVDQKNESIVSGINLPQTAAVIANGLALGKWIDDRILQADMKYGHELFDEQLHKVLAEKNIAKCDLDKAELMYTKSNIAKAKKDRYKKEVLSGFNKLIKFG